MIVLLFYGGSNKFSWRHTAKVLLIPDIVIEVNICANCTLQGLIVIKVVTIEHFHFQNTPEPLHRSIVKTAPCTGHTPAQTSALHFFLKRTAGILHTSVPIKQRLGIWIFQKRPSERLEHKGRIVAAA